MMRKAVFGAIAGARRRPADPAIYTTWVGRVDGAGGTYAVDSKSIALNLANALVAASYYSKLVFLLPLLGSNLGAFRTPLIDTLGKGLVTSTGFVNGDCNQAVGLAGNGSSKRFDSQIKASEVGASNSGGFFYQERNFAGIGANTEAFGNNTSAGQRYSLDLRPARYLSSWGGPTSCGDLSLSAGDCRIYANRASSVLRKMYRNGTLVDTKTASDTASEASQLTMQIMCCNVNGSMTFYSGTMGFWGCTDGTMSDADYAALDTLLGTYLMTPTGRT